MLGIRHFRRSLTLFDSDTRACEFLRSDQLLMATWRQKPYAAGDDSVIGFG
jgi:hypothetical protein